MALILLKCPNCYGEVQFDENMRQGFCIHCGAKMINESGLWKVKIDHGDEIRGKLELAQLSLKAGEIDRVTRLLDEVISLDPKASDAWLMKSLMYDGQLKMECIQKASSPDSNIYGVFTDDDLPDKICNVDIELTGNNLSSGGQLNICIDSELYQMDIGPANKLSIPLLKGRHTIVISMNSLSQFVHNFIVLKDIIFIEQDSRLVLCKSRLGWKISKDSSVTVVKHASMRAFRFFCHNNQQHYSLIRYCLFHLMMTL